MKPKDGSKGKPEESSLGELVFIGLGLGDERGITLRGIEEARKADLAFAEFYTNYVQSLSVERLEAIIGKKVQVLWRSDLEEKVEERVLKPALSKNIALLVPGDPMIATTHVAIRVKAFKMGIPTRVVPGVSIATAAVAASGLQNYRFGQSVSIPLHDGEGRNLSKTPYEVCGHNLEWGLHTLVFLDFQAEKGLFLTIKEAVKKMALMEEAWGEGVFRPRRLLVGIARVGSDDAFVRADYLDAIGRHDFGGPPYVLVVTGRLHFMEVDALLCLAQAPKDISEGGL